VTTVLMLGSGPSVTACRNWDRSDFDVICTINNAWRVRPDWDILVHPDDFPEDRRPTHLSAGQRVVTSDEYIPSQNAFGGIVYAGGTMAFTASYWALDALAPMVIAYLGCDMVYPAAGSTHFYGTGTADPLRPDITLRSLPAKSARLEALAARQGCALVNLSTEESRLTFPRAYRTALSGLAPRPVEPRAITAALTAEAEAAYDVPSGKYWKVEDQFDPAVIDRIDALWAATRPQMQLA